MFLTQILAHKHLEVIKKREIRPLNFNDPCLGQLPPGRSFKQFITKVKPKGLNLIAEIKKASPSKGVLCKDFDPVALAKTYEESGADAISVLTDEKFFQGSLDYLTLVKENTTTIPVLRKDFIIDPYQIIEAKIYGADAVLLIVAALAESELKEFIKTTRDLGLDSLVEVHDLQELEIALASGAEIIGINNRNLKTFAVNLETTYQLMQAIPPEMAVVSESGIHNYQDMLSLAAAGVKAILVGEAIVTATEPGKKIRELLGRAS
jgi:indole-3-glycerol phosphate synthase